MNKGLWSPLRQFALDVIKLGEFGINGVVQKSRVG